MFVQKPLDESVCHALVLRLVDLQQIITAFARMRDSEVPISQTPTYSCWYVDKTENARSFSREPGQLGRLDSSCARTGSRFCHSVNVDGIQPGLAGPLKILFDRARPRVVTGTVCPCR